MPKSTRETAPLLVPRSLVGPLMRLYDYPHPRKPGRVIRGYDRHHALRTARMCAAVARRLGHPEERVERYQIACLLHDLGRAGLDQELFGKIWSWARANGIPTRPREWRAVHPSTGYGRETEAFLVRYTQDLSRLGAYAEVAAVSRDSVWSHKAWAEKLGLKHRLLADMHLNVIKAYGLYHSGANISQRATVLIDKRGKVAWVKVESDIAKERDYKEVEEQLKKLA